MKKCRFCMKNIDEAASICPHCRKKQKSSSAPIIIIFLIIGIFSFIVFKFYNRSQLVIENSTGHANDNGQMIWEGDITNRGIYSQKNVKIEVICYTTAREKAGIASTSIRYINPGETLHFTATGLSQPDPNLQCEYKIK